MVVIISTKIRSFLLEHNLWTRQIDQGQSVDVIELDFARAFDKVPLKRLAKIATCWYKRKTFMFDRFLNE